MPVIKIADPFQKGNYKLEGLRPYSKYKLKIAGYSSAANGTYSDACIFTTYESKPSAPRNLTITKITNSSIELFWEPPEFLNGKIKYEIQHYIKGNDKKITNVPRNTNLTHTIHNLMSFQEYEISVGACTKFCEYVTRTIKTKIGIPGYITDENSTNDVLAWNVPVHKNGPVDYYELTLNFEINAILIGTKCTLLPQVATCDGSRNRYEFYIRAGNIMSSNSSTPINTFKSKGTPRLCTEQLEGMNERFWTNNITLMSDWFPIGKSITCEYFSGYVVQAIVLVCMILLVAAYLVKRKFNKMNNISVKLPDGLQNITKIYPNNIQRYKRDADLDRNGTIIVSSALSLTANYSVSINPNYYRFDSKVWYFIIFLKI